MQKSYDLWEEFEGISLYSISAIYGAFNSMIKIYNELKEDYAENQEYINNKTENLKNKAKEIKEYCLQTFYDVNRNSYVRNTEDRRMDMSILGSVIPFKMFEVDDSKIQNTIEQINNTLKTYTGGYVRYENDGYMGGKNPWPIVTLWMAWYYLEIGNKQKAMELFTFVTNSASKHGLLGEQVDNESMKPCWVIGLTWSHAMYVITLKKLMSN